MTIRNAESMGSFGASWTSAGFSGCGNVEPLLGTLRGRTAIVCGGAHTVFDELQHVLGRAKDPVLFAANDVGMYLPSTDHWVSLHANNLDAWKLVRWLNLKQRDKAYLHSIRQGASVDYAWELLTPTYALSGYFAMQIAYLMGADQIILCGCPGSAARRFFEAAPRSDFSYGHGGPGIEGCHEQIVKEMQRLPEFKAKVRSMGGWTRDFFGGM